MAKFVNIIKDESEFLKTIDMKKILSKRVIASTGLVVGRVAQIRFNTATKTFEGIVTKNLTHNPLYIGKSYIDKIAHAGVILNIEPSVFLRGRKVISYEGKVLGRVSSVNRKGNRNNVESIIFGAFMRKDEKIPFSAIDKVGKSIIMKKNYVVKQRYFWQRSN